MKKIGVVGLWHQGVVLAAVLAEANNDVIAYDTNDETVALLKNKELPVNEPGVQELLVKNNVTFTNNIQELSDCTHIFISHDTPVDENDIAQTGIVFDDIDALKKVVQENTQIIVTAQMPCGSCDSIQKLLPNTTVSYIPENLRLGKAVELQKTPALPVIGSPTKEAFEEVKSVFNFANVEWTQIQVKEAEMVKHALNSFLATSITWANQIGNICDEIGIDGWSVANALKKEPRVGNKAMIFPGLGYAGGTLGRDIETLKLLANQTNVKTTFVDAVKQANNEQNSKVAQEVLQVAQPNDVIGILGLTYKPDTSTLRRSLSLEAAKTLADEGHKIIAHDPMADEQEVKKHTYFERKSSIQEVVEQANVILLLTAWNEYKTIMWNVPDAEHKTVFDPNNILSKEKVQPMHYRSFGRGNKQ